MPEDVVTCTVAVDSDSASAEDSATIMIDNRAPNITDISISPNTDVTTSALLDCAVNATDPDGETPAITYEWSIGNTSISGAQISVNPSMVSPGDEIACTATASDAFGGNTLSSTVTVINTLPTLSLTIGKRCWQHPPIDL